MLQLRAECAVKTYNAWIMSLIASQSEENAKDRAEKLAQFQYAMTRLQDALRNA